MMMKISIGAWVFCALSLAVACGTTEAEPGPSVAGAAGSDTGGSNAAAAGASAGGAGGTHTGSAGAHHAAAGNGGSQTFGCTQNEDCVAFLGNTTPLGCATAKCSATTNQCVFSAVDADGDGFTIASCSSDAVQLEAG